MGKYIRGINMESHGFQGLGIRLPDLGPRVEGLGFIS